MSASAAGSLPQPTFDFASFMNTSENAGGGNNKRARAAESIQNPNVTNMRQNFNEQGVATIDSVIEGLGNLNMLGSEKQKLEDMAKVHDKMRVQQAKDKQAEAEKKAARSALEKRLKEDNNLVLSIMIKYAERFNKPDLQLKPRADADTTFAIDWGEKTQRKMDLDYCKEYMKDTIFIEKRPFVTLQQVENELERMFSEEERTRRSKSKPKPKLKTLTKEQIDPYRLIPMDEMMKNA